MKLGLYLKYSTRSLVRNGQRTLLAIFCVAVGVLAIVSLQLVGNMVNDGLTSNVRAGNGGDVSARNDIEPFTTTDLAYFDQLKSSGAISAYAPVSGHGVQSAVGGATKYYTLLAFDPTVFPLVGQTDFLQPSNGSLRGEMTGTNVVVTNTLLTYLGSHVGDTITVSSDDGRALTVTIAGEIESSGFFRRQEMLVSLDTYAATKSTAGKPATYSAIYMTVPGGTDANAATVQKDLQQKFPLATVTTDKDALQQDQGDVQNIRYFLQVVGLLALLIGGVGIINTMQVLLRRRRVEIAMLKTTGYRQFDLYALFGLEAAYLGLLGGAIGAAAGVGVSYFIKQLVERAFFIHLNFTVDPLTVGSGVLIGLATALIFGLLPIVQASQVRPQAVLRELGATGGVGGAVLTGFLLVLLAALFFLLAWSILGNVVVALGAVFGTLIFLAILSGVFGLAVVIVSRLPVPERLTWWFALLILVALAVSAAITVYLPGFGILFLALSLLGLVVVFLPRTWKSNVKMALRNLGRARVRTVTTMVALFVGVFAIGLVLVLGQNIQDKINTALSSQVKYNSFVIAGSADKPAVDARLQAGLPGLQGYKTNSIAQGVPVAVRGEPIAQILQGAGRPGPGNLGREGAVGILSSIQGYDLAGGHLPGQDVTLATKDVRGKSIGGRLLTAADATTNNVVISTSGALPPLSLQVGDQITMLADDHKTLVTLTVVGFWQPDAQSLTETAFGSVIGGNQLVSTLSSGHPFYVYQLKEDPAKADQALLTLQQAVPAVQTFSLVDLVLLVNQLLNNLVIMLIAVASLAMLAGVIIIANAVALAMLERRRELGILKSVGHTSASVLREVLMENGTIGFVGSLLALLLVTLATTVLAKLVFKTDFGVSAPLVLIITLATALVCMIVAAFVAWGATRVRPLEVLRYE